MTDARRPKPPLDDLLDAALARSVRRAPPADLRDRVMANVVPRRSEWGRPVALWTAVAAAAVAVAMIAPRALRTPAAPSNRTLIPVPVASAGPGLPSPEPRVEAGMATRPVAAPAAIRPSLSMAARAHVSRLVPDDGVLVPDVDEPAPLHIDALEAPADVPLALLHTEDLSIAPLAIEEAGSLSSEDNP